MAKRSALDILIVDDQLDVRLTLSAMLRELVEAKISVVKDGREAMIALGSERFDLLFLDLQLPVVTGEEVLDAIAAGEGNIQKPAHIVVMSAASRLQELQERLSADLVDGLLEKPFQYTDLQGIIADMTSGDFLSDI